MRLATVVFLASLSSAVLFGQAFTASLTGVVTDPNQAAVPNATIKIRNTATDETRTVTSGGEGRYALSQLQPGRYLMTVEAAGFKTYASTAFTLRANQAAEINPALQLGAVTETVEVAGAIAQLDTQSSNQSYTVGREQVLSLPAATRTPFIAVHSIAGVTSMSVAHSNNTGDQNQNRFAFNGGRDMSGLVLIDGVPATAGDWGGLLVSPSVESVQEVQVSRNSYDAEFGKSGGGVVSVVTKGGSNDFHGSAFEFLRNDNLDANAWANNRAGRPKVEFKRHQFGGNFSGPLWRSKKLYFLTTYEALKQGSPATTAQTVPTDPQRLGRFQSDAEYRWFSRVSLRSIFHPNRYGGIRSRSVPGQSRSPQPVGSGRRECARAIPQSQHHPDQRRHPGEQLLRRGKIRRQQLSLRRSRRLGQERKMDHVRPAHVRLAAKRHSAFLRYRRR